MTISNSAYLRLQLDRKPLGPQTHDWTPRDAVADAEALRLLFGAAVRAAGEGPSGGAALPVTLLRDVLDLLRQCLDDLLWDAARLFEGAYHRGDA